MIFDERRNNDVDERVKNVEEEILKQINKFAFLKTYTFSPTQGCKCFATLFYVKLKRFKDGGITRFAPEKSEAFQNL